MTTEVQRLQRRLDDIIGSWLKASPAERAQLIVEKVRLEDALEAARRAERAAS